MTTIAYHHKDKQIAVDSRTSCGSTIITDKCNKIVKRNGLVFVGCGGVIDIERMIEAYIGNDEEVVNLDATVYVIDDGKVFRCGQNIEDGFWRVRCDFNRSDGSGADYALAAMDFGRSASQAVKYAATRNVYTGGKIRVIDIK